MKISIKVLTTLFFVAFLGLCANAQDNGAPGIYIFTADYANGEGAKALITEGGTVRQETATKLFESLGIKMLTPLYFTLGEEYDVVAIIEVPSDAAGVYAALVVRSSGLVDVSITKLMLPEVIDEAAKLSGSYTAPGGK